MKKITMVLLFAALAFQAANAQKNIDPTTEDIALAKQLREKHGKDDVAVLSSKETISFELIEDGPGVAVNHHIAEKLMNISHRADIHKYEFYDSQSEIQDFSMTYRNDKNAHFEVKDEFYTSNDLFYNDYRVKYMEVTFPVQGYSYNYNLNKKYKDVKYFTSLYFNDEYPIVKKEIEILVPTWLEIEFKEMNFTGFDVKKTSKPDPKGKGTIYTYTLENVAARYKDESAPGPSYIYPHLLVVAKSYTKEGKKTTLFNSTADLYKWYKSLVDSVDENPDELKAKVNELIAGAKTDEEKIKKLYYWVQDNIRYIAFEDGLAGFRPDASQNVYKKRYGDCKGMANLMRHMLKIAGFDARLTWIGTKHIAYDYTTPSLCVDNHMICTLFKDGKKYFLDGTEKYNSFGDYAERIQGKEVMIEDGDKYIIAKVPVTPAASNKESYNINFSIDGEILKGKVQGNLIGESRAYFLYGYNNIKNDKKEDVLQNYLSRGDKNFSISNIKTSNLTDRDITLTVEYDAVLRNRVSSFDNEMYVDLDYLEEMSGLDFKERKTDFEFSYKKDYESNITLAIPQGYTVSRLPETLVVDTNDYTLTAAYEQKGSTIVYKKHFVIKNGTIKKTDFANWNNAITKLKKLYNDQITLTKL